MNEAFFTLHQGLPREGPGDLASLTWAVDLAAPPGGARILDAGCGPGADLAALRAAVPGSEVLGIERHLPFVEAARARHAGQAGIEVVEADMATPPGTFDLIWCAGALYFLGVEVGLHGWRSALRPGGKVAFSEACWFTEDRPGAAVEMWQDHPAMTDEAGVLRAVAAAGYEVLGTQRLSDAAWEAYYTPMEARIARLRAGGADAALEEVLQEGAQEVATWRAHRDAFGYLLVVARPR